MKYENPLLARYKTHLRREGLTQQRINKLTTLFYTTNQHLGKPLEAATRADIEKLIDRLNAGKIRGHRTKKPFSSSTVSDIKKFIRQFYKWLRGNNEFYPPEVSWIKTRIPKDQKPAEKEVLSIEEVKRLADHMPKEEQRILTLLLFDSGFRISEMLSVRKSDLTLEPFDEGQSCYWVSCRRSKTVERKVPVPLFTEDIRHFCKSATYEEKRKDDPLFSCTYYGYRKILGVRGEQLFKKRISPHSLRHSSATYYARALDGDMMIIADRYGWAIGSSQMATYIRRSGAYQRKQAKRVYVNEVEELREKVRGLEEQREAFLGDMKRLEELFRKENFYRQPAQKN